MNNRSLRQFVFKSLILSPSLTNLFNYFCGFFFEFTEIVLFLHQLLPILWKTIGSCVYVVEFSISFFLEWKHWCCRLILILNSLCFCFAVKQRYLSVADGKPWSPNGTQHACPDHFHASRLPVCPNQVSLRHGSGIANPLACSPTLFQCGIGWCKYHCWWWKAWSSLVVTCIHRDRSRSRFWRRQRAANWTLFAREPERKLAMLLCSLTRSFTWRNNRQKEATKSLQQCHNR